MHEPLSILVQLDDDYFAHRTTAKHSAGCRYIRRRSDHRWHKLLRRRQAPQKPGSSLQAA